MSRPRVLLIEDEPALVRGVSDMLAANGFDVQVATDGAGRPRRPRSAEAPSWSCSTSCCPASTATRFAGPCGARGSTCPF